MKELTVNADVKNLDKVISLIDGVIEPYECSVAVQFQIEVALEEIYVNIAYYAYPNDIGSTTVRCNVEETEKGPMLVVDILDQGNQYNPLEHEGPDLEAGYEEREIGGLGIYMVRSSMDVVSYRYEEKSNIFTIKKYLKD